MLQLQFSFKFSKFQCFAKFDYFSRIADARTVLTLFAIVNTATCFFISLSIKHIGKKSSASNIIKIEIPAKIVSFEVAKFLGTLCQILVVRRSRK